MSWRTNRETGGKFRTVREHANEECARCGAIIGPYDSSYASVTGKALCSSCFDAESRDIPECASCGRTTTIGFGACPNCGSFMKVTPSIQMRKRKASVRSKTPLFKCQECGHKFYSAKSAERASYGDSGCPGCGGTDIDIYTE